MQHECRLHCIYIKKRAPLKGSNLSFILVYKINNQRTIEQRDLACVASVPVRAKCHMSRASEDSGRVKIEARAKMWKEQGGGTGTLATQAIRDSAGWFTTEQDRWVLFVFFYLYSLILLYWNNDLQLIAQKCCLNFFPTKHDINTKKCNTQYHLSATVLLFFYENKNEYVSNFRLGF